MFLPFKPLANNDICISRKYPEIIKYEDRLRYKTDFNRDYEEYRRLHAQLGMVAKRFSELEATLNTKVEGSEEWNVNKNFLCCQVTCKFCLLQSRLSEN